jgi:hypothetical protein
LKSFGKRAVVIFAGILLLIVTALLFGFIGKNATRFSGDGVLTDSGFWSYPRYQIGFNAIHLDGRSNHVFRFRGGPSIRMWFGLELIADQKNPRPDALEMLNERDAELRVTIEGENGKLVAATREPLKAWIIAQSSQRKLLWHPSLRDLPFTRRTSYRVTIELINDAAGTPSLFVRPILEGGGNELP